MHEVKLEEFLSFIERSHNVALKVKAILAIEDRYIIVILGPGFQLVDPGKVPLAIRDHE